MQQPRTITADRHHWYLVTVALTLLLEERRSAILTFDPDERRELRAILEQIGTAVNAKEAEQTDAVPWDPPDPS